MEMCWIKKHIVKSASNKENNYKTSLFASKKAKDDIFFPPIADPEHYSFNNYVILAQHKQMMF